VALVKQFVESILNLLNKNDAIITIKLAMLKKYYIS
jgi:hypothetical protein